MRHLIADKAPDADDLRDFLAGQGAIGGPPPEHPAERSALSILYTALLTDACLDALGGRNDIVLDGSFTSNPLYGSLVAAIRPEARVRVGGERAGPAAGAALSANHVTRIVPVPADLRVHRLSTSLAADRARWKTICTEIPR